MDYPLIHDPQRCLHVQFTIPHSSQFFFWPHKCRDAHCGLGKTPGYEFFEVLRLSQRPILGERGKGTSASSALSELASLRQRAVR